MANGCMKQKNKISFEEKNFFPPKEQTDNKQIMKILMVREMRVFLFFF